MRPFRLLLVGGILSYRALFGWLSPWILIPSLLVTPLAQILLFVYIGRSAGVGDDGFFVIGNAVQYAAIPCLIGMTSTVVGDRLQGTLGIVFASPASRFALVIGRALPVMLNGLAVSLFGVLAGSALLGVEVDSRALAPIALAIVVSVVACTGLGLVNAAFGLRLRDTAIVSNLLYGILLLASGANIPRHVLPGWLAELGSWLPLTHGIEAARRLADGAALGDVRGLLATEVALGLGYGVLGVVMLRVFEVRSRDAASLERL
ncbi:ABC transporter permease [Actinophytocola glycyrrhizae]|uniref:ABC transporter permease n=1 Tax=Actinophytocola glycyrrhizae TaxID=2044873 RepID=A0ABV9S4R1_9PSEU